jgi:hypothetical protein
MAFSRDGKKLWQRSMMEEYGRLTFPNGRTGSLAIDGNLVITDGITANWGTDGPASNRFYAFDKTNRRTRLVLHSGHGPSTARLRRRSSPISAITACSTPAPAAATSSASMRAPANRSGVSNCPSPASTPTCSSPDPTS